MMRWMLMVKVCPAETEFQFCGYVSSIFTCFKCLTQFVDSSTYMPEMVIWVGVVFDINIPSQPLQGPKEKGLVIIILDKQPLTAVVAFLPICSSELGESPHSHVQRGMGMP